MQLSRKQIHEQVYFYTLILIAVSLPLSVFTTSMFMFLLGLNWLVEGSFAEKWKKMKGNRALQIFLLLYGLHAVGIFWSTDLEYWLWDMKIKLPLLILPLIIASSQELDRSQLQRILFFFTLSVFAASIASLLKLLGWLPGEVKDYRDLSLFMSHIRFSLMIVLAYLHVIYSLFISRNDHARRGIPGDTFSSAVRIFNVVVLFWFPVFLILLKSLSGLVIAALLGFFFLWRLVFEIRDRVIRFVIFVAVIMIPLFSVAYLGHCVNKFYTFDPLNVEELDTETAEGNTYSNMTENRDVENGHYTWIYVCDLELEREWESVSEMNYWDRTPSGQSLRSTLIRFLTSKGLRKDAVGIKQLTETEIRAIEQGTANYTYLQRFKLYPRIYEVIWEIDRYRRGYDPNEKSVVQRYLYLEAGWHIAQKHLFIGVGNGDVWKEFLAYYESVQSPLETHWRRKSHNQYLTFLISFGIPGMMLCMLALIAPLYLAKRNHSFLAMGILILILLSMLSEDTLETTAAASFFAYFYSLFLFGPDFPWLRNKSLHTDG